MIRKEKKAFIIFLILGLLTSGLTAQGKIVSPPFEHPASTPIPTDAIIQQGLQTVGNGLQGIKNHSSLLLELKNRYNGNPFVSFASLVGTTITVKFIDGSYTVIMDAFSKEKEQMPDAASQFLFYNYPTVSTHIAVLLNPFEYLYGHQQCNHIIATLLRHDYRIEYLANEAVDLLYLRHNLTADIVYMDTHAGYFDLNGDQQADSVVIATGEPWTNNTEQTYGFEYQHQLIVKGMVGDKGFVTFTPAFIEYYYPEGSLTNSLIYMATCYATYDASMAQAFLDAGASAYMGWTKNTVFWTNSRMSVNAIRLLISGCTVHQVCTLIRFGGVYNRLFHSKLVYYGDGDHRIPT